MDLANILEPDMTKITDEMPAIEMLSTPPEVRRERCMIHSGTLIDVLKISYSVVTIGRPLS